MAKKTAPLLPATDELLRRFGGRLRLARLRRKLSAKQVAERAGMAPMTLRSLERGGSGVTIGAYLAVMQVLGLEKDLDRLGEADVFGRELQDSRLPESTRAGLKAVASPQAPAPAPALVPLQTTVEQRSGLGRPPGSARKPAEAAQDWARSGGFASADVLAGLIDPPALAPAKTRR